MIQNNKWETIVGILIWVFIISIVILWIGSLINYSRTTIAAYERSTKIQILKDNLTNIIQQIDIDAIQEDEMFYVYKNESEKKFEVFTWATNEQYKYVDANGTKIDDLIAYEWDIYARILWLEREDTSLEDKNKIIRASVKRLIKTNPN